MNDRRRVQPTVFDFLMSLGNECTFGLYNEIKICWQSQKPINWKESWKEFWTKLGVALWKTGDAGLRIACHVRETVKESLAFQVQSIKREYARSRQTPVR